MTRPDQKAIFGVEADPTLAGLNDLRAWLRDLSEPLLSVEEDPRVNQCARLADTLMQAMPSARVKLLESLIAEAFEAGRKAGR